MTSSKLSIEAILAESDREVTRFDWDGTFADYLRMVIRNPSLSRLSHALVHDAIISDGVKTSPGNEPVYSLFEEEIFGLERHLHTIVQYFAAGSQRLEVRKRILLLLGPPASGKSTVVDLIKNSLERYTRTDNGAVYAIRGCPMQEEPLHLIPEHIRKTLKEHYGIHIEGDLCPRCSQLLRSSYEGKISEIPVERIVLDEREAVGIGHYLATNATPTDASRLVGGVDEAQMNGHDRLEVAAKAFRFDGELNIANRGLMEFVEMFKADRHMLNTLLDLAQGQVIKNLKFGSVYADEVIVGHSNEGDFDSFVAEVTSEALRDRIIAIQVPYNLKVQQEVKIYQKMMTHSRIENIHLAPLSLQVASTFATLTRLDPPHKQGMSLIDKLHLYDGQMVLPYTVKDVHEMQQHHRNEGMQGISPRYVMNRIGAAASIPGIRCISPLAALDSLWQGLAENVSLEQDDNLTKYIGIVTETVKEYSELAIKEIQRAFEDSFEESANMLLNNYLANISSLKTDSKMPSDLNTASEPDMREIERSIGIKEMNKNAFREEIRQIVSAWGNGGWEFTYESDPRLKSAIETRLFPPKRKVQNRLTQPRFAKQRVEWSQRRSAIKNRLNSSYGYCSVCSEDLINYATLALKNKPTLKTPKGEGVEWMWPLFPETSM